MLVTTPPPPMTMRIAHAAGQGSVTVAASTGRLRTGVWLFQLAGRGKAKVTVSCERRVAHGGTGTVIWFHFVSGAGSRHELWRYAGGPCDVEVTVVGRGRIVVELRGR